MRKLPFFFFCAALGALSPCRGETFTIGVALGEQHQRALDELLAAQQDPQSPQYRRWLSPAEFRQRFAPRAAEWERLKALVRGHGLRIELEAQSGLWLRIEGSEQSLRNLMARETSFQGFFGLPEDRVQFLQNTLPPSRDGGRSVTPEDIAVIYNLSPLHRSGNLGSGIKIVIPGEVDLDPADWNAFRARFNLPAASFTKVQVGAAPPPFRPAAAAEANLSVQWAGAMARQAEIVYVYAQDARTAFFHAVDQNLGHVVSLNFGECEAAAQANARFLRTIVQQANAQGMTVIAASGDAGPAGCDAAGESPQAAKAHSAMLPASIPEVTAVGGTALTPIPGPYWRPAPDFNGVSALGYVPESVWNDTASLGTLSASGGGPSRVFTRPDWQTGPGIPASNFRAVPDLAFAASSFHNGYVTRQGGAWRVAGGTSVAAPVFAGIVAVLQHYLIRNGQLASPGLGNLNPALYRMWRGVPAAFHDITEGDAQVPCTAGTPQCAGGRSGYPATSGYDYATGLGSVDANILITRWDSSPALRTAISLNTDATAVSFNGTVRLEVIVRSAGAASPSGPVTFFNSGGPSGPSGAFLGSVNLIGAGGSASGVFQLPAHLLRPGANRVVAYFAGSSALDGSSAAVTINVTLPGGQSAVALEVNPGEISEEAPDLDGNRWFFTLTLRELGGNLTTIATLNIGDLDLTSQVRSLFGNNGIPGNGSLSARIALKEATTPSLLRILVTGSDFGGFSWTRELFVPIYGRGQRAILSRGGMVNGASFQPGIAPGMITSLFGAGLAAGTGPAPSLPLPPAIAGATATVNGISAPLYFASPGQLNLQMPYEITPGSATLRLTVDFPNGQREILTHTFTVVAAAPGIFAGPGNTLVPFASGSRGSTLLAFITGDGLLTPALPTGRGPSPETPLNQLPRPVLPVRLTVGGIEAPLAFVGVPPGLAGATQINFVIPPGAPLGEQDVVVTVGGVPSPPVKLRVEN
jgi:uncharacterized protein (TIGR03437 family)